MATLFGDTLGFGTAYYPDHWSESEWERDLKLIHDSGLSTIRFGEFSWSWFEPRQGAYDFRSYDRFMDLVKRCGLNIILATPTCNPPHWFFRAYPDARQIDQRGRPHVGHRHMANFNHVSARETAEQTVLKLAEHYRDHPALLGWQIDNELTAGEGTSSAQVYDYHPVTIAAYRQYLQERYPSLDALNDAWLNNFWSNRYTDWEEIDPPYIGENRVISSSMWLEWARFRDFNVAQLGRWQLKWLRSVNANFVIGTNIPEVTPLTSVWLGQDYWALCEGMDFIGTDLYVYRNEADAEQEQLAYSCDLIRSAAQANGAEFGILETQAGPHILPWRMTFAGGMWELEFLQRSVQTFVEHGANYVFFFLWRAARGAAEFGMNGLVEMDGSPSPRSAALPEIIAQAHANRDDQPHQPTIYVHYSRATLQILALNDPDNRSDPVHWGWHHLLCDLGYRVKYINDAELETLTLPAHIPLVLPHSMVLSDTACSRIRKLIADGRKVVLGFATAYFDAFGCIYPIAPGGCLSETLGIRYVGFSTDHPSLQLHGMNTEFNNVIQSQIKLTEKTDHTLFHDRFMAQCVTKGSAVYLPFDLGSLYYQTPTLRPEVAQWVKTQTGL